MDLIRNNGHNPKLRVLIQPNIGLGSDARDPVVEILNKTLADEAVLTQKTRNAHWNMTGPDFLELHAMFETQYEQLNHSCNEIAERARMLGGVTIGSFDEYLKHTRLEEQPGCVADILHLLADHETVIRFLREDARKCTEEYEDEGTFNMLVEKIRIHEQMAWILRSIIENDPVYGESQEGIIKDERSTAK
jgi:starvation-inducible DNA-binding protein